MRITKFGCVWYPIVWLISRKYLVEHSRPSMENRKLFFSFISTKVFINQHIFKQTWTHVLDFKMPTFFTQDALIKSYFVVVTCVFSWAFEEKKFYIEKRMNAFLTHWYADQSTPDFFSFFILVVRIYINSIAFN